MKVTFDNQTFELTPAGKGYLAVFLELNAGRDEEKTLRVEMGESANGVLRLLIDGQPVSAVVSADGAKRWVTLGGRTYQLTKSSGVKRGPGHGIHAEGALLAPMPGQVRAVNVAEGQIVERGQTLLVLEAMKMEIRVQAPARGVVKNLKVKQGQSVEKDQPLVEIAREEE